MGALVFMGVEDVRSVFDHVYTMPYSEFGTMLEEAFACMPVGNYVGEDGSESGRVYALTDVLDLMVDPLFELATREGDTRDMQNATAYMTVVQNVRELERVGLVITEDSSVAHPLMDAVTAREALGLWLGSADVPVQNEPYWMRMASLMGKAIACGYMQNIWGSVCPVLECLGEAVDEEYWNRLRDELFIELYCSKISLFSPSTRVA